MKRMAACLLLTSAIASLAAAVPAQTSEVARAAVQGWMHSPEVLQSIEEANGAHRSLSDEAILALDRQWVTELRKEHSERRLINQVLSRPLSTFLREKAEASNGLIRELFVTDTKGLLVGANRITSDYWQGDEDKWLRPFRDGASAHVSEVAKDESTQTYLVHVSFPIVEPGASRPAGVLTVGINVEKLTRLANND